MDADRPGSSAAQTALVTGASGGLGPAVVEVFAQAGWRVVAASRRAAGGGPPRSAEDVEPIAADLTDEAEVAHVVEAATARRSSPLAAVVNLVGGFAAGARVADSSPDEFEALLRLNVRPTYLVTRAALPHLVEHGQGAIVSVSSRAAASPFPRASAYVTAKAAVTAFSNAVAVEYGPRAVRSNVVVPGMIDTPANRAAQPEADRSAWTDPRAIAHAIHFLASDASRAINGAAIPV